MSKILGLDLGTNSIGWALVDKEKITSNNKKIKEQGIIDCGCRIFREGVNKNSSGKEISKNAVRRDARSKRRNYYRFKTRRKYLIEELSKIGMLPDNKHYTFEAKDKKNHTIELFKLRKDALRKQLRLEDIGRIFMQINNHRGFKSNKKEDAVTDPDKKKELQGVKGTIERLKTKMKEYNCCTIGEYYYYLIEQNHNSFNPNEPAPKLLQDGNFLRGPGAYTARELFEDEFDKIWNKQKEYYPDIFTDENKDIIKEDCIFYQRDLRSAKHLRNRCKLENKGYLKDKDGKKHINYLPCCPKSSFEFQEFRIWEQLNKLRYTNNVVTHCPLKLEQKNKLATILHEKEKLSLSQIKKILNLTNNTKFNDIGDSLKGNITQARLIEALGKDFWIKNIHREEDSDKKKFKPIEYSNVHYQLWHNIEFAKDKNWLSGDKIFLENVHRKNKRFALKRNKQYSSHSQWIQNIQKLGLTENQVLKYSELVFETGYSDYSTKAIKKLLCFMKQGDDPVTASYKVYGDYASTIQPLDIEIEHKIPALVNNRLKNPVVEKAVKETIKIINAIIDKYGKPDKINLEMTRELKMPKDARENTTLRNSNKDKAREEYAKFLSNKLQRNIDKTSPDIKKFEMFLELNYSKESLNGLTKKEIEDFFRLKIPTNKTKYYLWLECDRKDPYEGKTINLSTLFSPEIEIEHIVPYSLCGDNSFMNKTLSFKDFNAKKGNKTPLQYFYTRPDYEKKEFEKNIKNLPDSKKERFLLTDEKIDVFRNCQLNNTSYIATEVRKHLLKSYKNEDIELTNGTMTSLVRTLLGLNGILQKPVKVDLIYKGMGKVWAILNENNEIVDYIERNDDNSPENTKTIKGVINYSTFYPSKTRDDNRHHTIDALVTALLNKKINNSILKSTEGYANKETGEYISKYYTNDKGEHKLTKEAINDIKEKLLNELNLSRAEELLAVASKKIDNILISYQNEKLRSLPRKKLYTPNGKPFRDKNGKHLRSGGISVRHEIHDANFYGKTKECNTNEFVKRIKLSELTFNQLTNIVDKKIQKVIISRIGRYALDILNSEDKPIELENESLKTIEKIKEFILLTIREYEIKNQKTEIKGKKEKEVSTLRKHLNYEEKIIKEKLLKYKNDAKKIKSAIEKGMKQLLKVGVFLENEGKRQRKLGNYDPKVERSPVPIRKVRVKYVSNNAMPIKNKKITAKLTPNSIKELNKDDYQYVMPGNNYLYVIYGDDCVGDNGCKRDMHIVSWYDKAKIDLENYKRKKENKSKNKKLSLLPYYPAKDLPLLCALSHNDLVIVYKDNPDEINWGSQEELFNRLFTVVKFTEKQIIIARHNISNIKADQATPVKDILSGEGVVIRPSANTFMGIKVHLSVLGKIIKNH